MAKQSFESIVEGQLPPDDWYAYGFDEQFSLLEPNSALGQMALRLRQEYDEASEEYFGYLPDDRDDDDHPDWIVFEEEIDRAGRELDKTYEREWAFQDLYREVWQALCFPRDRREVLAESQQNEKSPYQVSVDRAVSRLLAKAQYDLNCGRRNSDHAREVAKVIREASPFYILEEEVHRFSELETARF